MTMELGETLTITASLSTTTFVAMRSRTNTEVTIRISPPGGCSSPVITKRTNPRAPSCKLSSSPLAKPQPTPIVHNTTTSQLPLDQNMLQGWVMVSTLSYWSIAWVTATISPSSSRICIKLESEVDSKSLSPSLNFEEIDTIVELNHDNADGCDPVKFEIKTKDNIYKILTNSFMTVGMRDLMQHTLSATTKATTPTPCSTKTSAATKSTISKGTLTRLHTPKPSIQVTDPNIPATTVNIPPKSSFKSSISRTNTPLPDFSKTIPPNTTRRLKTKSGSLGVIPAPAAYKAAPRPVSINVYAHIQKSDLPQPKDKRDKLRLPAQHSSVVPWINYSHVVVATSILTECANFQNQQEESDFSTWDSDDNASDFSEVGENLSEWEHTLSCCGVGQLANLSDQIDSDFEIRDLCEMSKGLSPEINYTLGCPDDTSSCFSEGMSEIDCSILPDSTDDIDTDYFSDRSTMMSSVSSSAVFEGTNAKNNKGLRGIQKLMPITSKQESASPRDTAKLGKWEQKQLKQLEKEAKRAARHSKLLEKKEKKEKKREQEASSPKRPLSVRVKGCVRKFFGKGEVKEIEGH